jgi:hypothetical protein
MSNHSKYQNLLDACKGLPPTPTAVVHPCDRSSLEGAIGASTRRTATRQPRKPWSWSAPAGPRQS